MVPTLKALCCNSFLLRVYPASEAKQNYVILLSQKKVKETESAAVRREIKEEKKEKECWASR